MDKESAPGHENGTGRLFLIACVLAWCQGSAAAASADTDVLPGITVTGSRSPESLSRLSNNVTVITAEDITRSPATDLSSLLASEANLSILNFYGNDKKASIDMRGMGDSAASNVLVLVDGERLNETDLSGADLSTLSLSQIERIDVIRGGGAVRYGQGAVGGVINITTKRPGAGALETDFGARFGSYNTKAVQAAVRGGSDSVAAQILLSHSSTDGYRDNSAQESNTANLEVRRLPQSDRGWVDLFVRATLHDDTYGLPGGVSREAFNGDDRSRRSTTTPLDGGATHDYRLTLGSAWDWGPGGKMSLRLSRRERDNPYLFGADASTIEAARSLIRSERNDLQWRYDLVRETDGRPQALTLGIDTQDGRYARWGENGVKILGGSLISGEAQTRSFFVDTNTSPVKGLNLHAGARQDWFSTGESHKVYDRDCTFNYQTNQQTCAPGILLLPDPNKTDVPTRRWSNTSAELGFAWAFRPTWTWFGSLSRHVRDPNLDELAQQADTLHPQQGYTLEQGVRHALGSGLSWSLTGFVMRIEDEIYYNSLTQENRNYEDATLRKGLELEARWRPNNRWSLRGQWAYVLPKFEGVPGNPDIPLVPRNTFSTQVNWDITDQIQWTVQGRHGSQRLDGDARDFPDLPNIKASTVVDTAWRLHRGSWQLSLGVNNLFNEVYATMAYANTLYPMPGRNAYIEWRLNH